MAALCARQPALTLILADIDHFKRYNDILGHPQGDDCIRGAAAVFVRVVGRSGDYVAKKQGRDGVSVRGE